MDLLHIKPGSTVADIGAGGGWFSVRAARRVTPSGRVIAEDINTKTIPYIQQRAQREHLNNIVALLGTPDDPKLAPDSLDAALMLKVYHEIAHPQPVLANVRAALKPGLVSASSTRMARETTTDSTKRFSAPRWSMPASSKWLAMISPKRMGRITF